MCAHLFTDVLVPEREVRLFLCATIWTHLGIPQPLVDVSMQAGWALVRVNTYTVSAVSVNAWGHA